MQSKLMDKLGSLVEWVDKPVYKSRKFIYALGTFLAALFVWALPQLVELIPDAHMTPEQTKLMTDMLPLVFVVGLSLIAGHTVTDVAAIWKEGVKAKSIAEALQLLLDSDTPVTDDLKDILEAAGVKLE